MSSSRRIGMVLALSVGLGNFLSGCGGDDDGATTGGKGGSGGKAGAAGKAGKGGTAGKSGAGGKGGSGAKGGAGGSSAGGTAGKGGSGTGGSNGGRGGTGTAGTGTAGTGTAGTSNNGGMAGDGDGGTSGRGGRGGTAGTAGTSGTSGTSGSAGTAGTAGTSAGGSSGEGGDTGAGGAGAGGEAGDSSSGGTAGIGGTAGTGGGCPTATRLDVQNFDTDNSGAYSLYEPTATGVASYDSVEGNPNPGSAKLVGALADFGDQVAINFWLNGADWTCKTKAHAMIKLHAAANVSHILAVHLSIATNGYAWYTGEGNYLTFQQDTWQAIELDFDGPYTFNSDPSAPKLDDVSQVSVMLQAVDSGTTPVETTVYVDDIWVE